jgi:type II secretory pathway pseudopilin PulG
MNIFVPVKREEAFTMAELMVGIALMGVMFVSLYAGLSSGFAIIDRARQNLRATQVALEKMETIRMYSWEQINSNGFVPPTFTAPFYPLSENDADASGIVFHGTTKILPAEVPSAYSNDMRQVIVTVSWTNSNLGFTREMRTFISQYGMQRYIY